MNTPAAPVFARLTPEVMLRCVERALGVRCGAVCRPMPSYINRVYEAVLEDGTPVIAKFYRPGRWSRAALEDELEFLAELHAAEVPVVPPFANSRGDLLHPAEEHVGAEAEGWFSVFPKKGGRAVDEPAADDWAPLGRLIARMHAVGSRHPPRDRITMHPAHSTTQQLEALLQSDAMDATSRRAYEREALALLGLITPLFTGVELQRIHGDCHRMNILHRPGEGFHLIDFDDMALGPVVQDLWMLLPGRRRDTQAELSRLLEGYQTFHDFPFSTLRLIEPLRGMRFVHYAAWCERQARDGTLSRLAPDWGTPAYWRRESDALAHQRQEILDDLSH